MSHCLTRRRSRISCFRRRPTSCARLARWPPTEMADGEGEGSRNDTRPHYLGVGCFSVIAGFAGGGMIAVLIAKIVGALARCPAEPETGAPCNWFTYAVFGAVAGAVILPTLTVTSLRRARRRAENSERG